METNSTHPNTLKPGDILSVKEVLELMPPSITQGWLYSHWEELGGVTVANKKLILKEVLYANFKGTKPEILREGLEEQEVVYTCENGNVGNQLEDQIRCQESGGKTPATDRRSTIIDHSDPFNLT